MANKETIALVGDAKGFCDDLVHKLAAQNFRLLLITEDQPQLSDTIEQIRKQLPDAAIELVDCVKEGCWEADIIVLLGKYKDDNTFINRMKEVSIQKLVVDCFVETEHSKESDIENEDLPLLLPHSKIVQLFWSCELKTASISWEDEEAVEGIVALVKKLGYKAEKVTIIQKSLNGN